MIRSFRFHLAFRFTATMTVGIVAFAALGYLAFKTTLDRQIEASLLNVAAIQASAATEDPSGEMRFHGWNVTPREATTIRELIRYAQIWNEEGESLLRSRYLERDLPLDMEALRRAADGHLVQTTSDFRDTRVRSLYYPLVRLGERHANHILQVSAPLGARDRTLRTAALLLAGVTLVVTGGTGVGSWWLAGRAVRPVHDVIDQTEEIGASDLSRRITAHADTREYERLVRVLNTMLERIDSAFEAQRRFIADASHEMRSPLTALRGELEIALRKERSEEEYRRVLESALEEAERLSRIAADLLTLARSDAGVIEPRLRRLDLGQTVRGAVDRLRPMAREQEVRLEVRTEDEVPGLYDADLIQRLTRNLVENAIKYTPEGGEVEIVVGSGDEGTELRVSDTGPGIPEEELEKVFERFYQVDPARNDVGGTGLGLSLVRAIARAHGGEVRAENVEAGGAVFRVRFGGDGPGVSGPIGI